jgi:hypothetical protein
VRLGRALRPKPKLAARGRCEGRDCDYASTFFIRLRPVRNERCTKKNKMTMGSVVITEAAIRELAGIRGEAAPITSCYLDVDGRRLVRHQDVEHELDGLLRVARERADGDASVRCASGAAKPESTEALQGEQDAPAPAPLLHSAELEATD